MEEALIARLLAATALTALVNASITVVQRPEVDGLPGVTIAKVSPGLGGPRGMYHQEGRNDWQSPRIQFDCWGRSPLEARQVFRALLEEMEQPRAVNGIAFDEALLDSESDEPPEQLEGGTDVFRVMADMLVPWKPE